MQTFTGKEYLKIDIANCMGMDKELFQTRLDWVDANYADLESFMDTAEDPILYIKAVNTLRKADRKEPSGHMVAFDACASGLQIMGALTGCVETCRNTGLIDPNVRADIYLKSHAVMNMLVTDSVEVERKPIKLALMTHFYGSYREPLNLFGEGDVLEAFYETTNTVAPGAAYLRDLLIQTWQSFALDHSWCLPDGFHAYVPVMQRIDMEIEVDELNHAQFTHRIKINEGSERGVGNVANPVHSIDAMFVREMNRRCNYDSIDLYDALAKLHQQGIQARFNKCKRFISLRWASPEWIDRLDELSINEKEHLMYIIEDALDSKSFPIVCIHDAFKAHPNNMDRIRKVYRDILIELSYSEVIEDIIEQITGTRPKIVKGHPDIGSLIRKANYHLS